METQVIGVKPQKPFQNSFSEINGRRKQPPYYNDFDFPATTGRRLQPPYYNDFNFQLQLEGATTPSSSSTDKLLQQLNSQDCEP